MTESTISIQISRLERSGYVRQISDSLEGRRVRVRLTSAGRRVQEQNSVLDPDLVLRMISLLPSSDVEAALNRLEVLATQRRN